MKFIKEVSVFAASMLVCNVFSNAVLINKNVKAAELTPDNLSTNFITTNVDKLMDGANQFRFVSFNVPELTMNESPYWRIPTNFDQEDALKSIAAIGGKVTRTYVFSVKSPDNPGKTVTHIQGIDAATGKLQFNEDAFKAFDNALALSHKYGVRLFVPFVDNWSWWGGIHDYDRFAGVTPNTSLGDDPFWTDLKVRAIFEQTISYVLNRTNTITGTKYMDDPAILAWETGNELAAPAEWTQAISTYIKSIDKNHLVMDGRQGVLGVDKTAYPNIDILSNHYYGGSGYAARATADRTATIGKKPFIVGEFGIAEASVNQSLVKEVIDNGSAGTMIWSLRQHKPEGGFFSHYEYNGYSAYHLPGFATGSSYDETDMVKMIRDGAARIDGLSATPKLPTPDAPTLLPITSVENLNWQGSVGASGYNIERADSNSGQWTVVGANVSDSQVYGVPLFHDTSAATGNTYYYRINAENESGTSSYSNIVGPVVAKHIIEDDMYGFTNTYLHSANLESSGDNMDKFGNDYNRIKEKVTATSALSESIVYATPTTASSIKVTTYFNKNDNASDFKFETSSDNETYTSAASPTKTSDAIAGSDWSKVTYTFSPVVEANVKFIKISFPTDAKDTSTAPQIGRADIEYAFDGQGTLPVVIPPTLSGIITDELNDFSNIYKQSANLGFDTGNTSVGGDKSLLNRTDNKVASITYKTFGDLNSFRATTFFWTGDTAVANFKFYTSADGITFADFTPTVNDLGGDWKKVQYEAFNVPAGTRYLKMEFPTSTLDANNWTPEISRVELGVGAIQISKPASKATNIIDTFESYGGSSDIVAPLYVRNPGGDPAAVTLSDTNKIEGSYGMKLSYQLGSSGYAGVEKALDKADYSGYNSLKLWVKPDGTGNDLTFQLKTGQGRYWEGHYIMTKGDTTGKYITIPFSDFKQPTWDAHEASMDLNAMAAFAIYIGGSDHNANSVYMDSIQVTSPLVIENADTYGGDDTILQSKWSLNTGGDPATVSLDVTNKAEGNAGMKLNYQLGAKGYAGLSKSLGGADYTGTTALKLWVKSDGSGNDLTFQFKDAAAHYWEAKYVMTGTTEGFITIPFNTFVQPSWDGKEVSLGLLGMTDFAIYIGGGKSLAANTVYLDSIQVINTDTQITVATVAAGVTSIVTPKAGVKTLTLPTVAYGYSIAIKSATSTPAAIALDGTITPPAADTTVAVVFTVTNVSDNSTADTSIINVVVPAKPTGVTPGLKWNFEDGTLQGWIPAGWDAKDNVTYSEDLKTETNKGSAKINAGFTPAWSALTIEVPLTSDGSVVDLSQYDTASFDVYVPTKNADGSVASLVSLKPQIDFNNNYAQGPDVYIDLLKSEKVTIGSVDYLKSHVVGTLALTSSAKTFVIKLGNDQSTFTGALYIDNIALGNSNYVEPTAVTAATVAADITSVVAPAKDATSLTLPTVPQGYTIAIKSATPIGVIVADGTITLPTADTTVALVFTVTKTVDGTTADTTSINVVVPANKSIASMNNLIAKYAKDGKLGHQIVAQLENDLKQAEHQLEKGSSAKAIKFMNDVIKHLNNSGLTKVIDSTAKDVLINDAKELIKLWQK